MTKSFLSPSAKKDRLCEMLVAGAFAMVLMLPMAALAQTTSGDLTGTVSDPSGGAIPNATVTVTEQSTGVKATQTTTAAGVYRFANLSIGKDSLSVLAQGAG